MKISRPAPPQPLASASKLSAAARARGKDGIARAERIRAKHTVAGTGSAEAPAASLVSDIGSALKAGRITPEAAIDKVIERVIAQQLGIHATPAAKEKIGAALRERLADDPLLAAKVRALRED